MLPGVYQPKTVPWPHQAEGLALSHEMSGYALLMEQRTGKTKIVIDTVAYQYERGTINALLVVAMPDGVQRNWLATEIPLHMPDRVPRLCLEWEAEKATRKYFQEAMEKLLTFKGLAILAVNGEAIITNAFRKYATRFLKARRVFVAADETTLIMKTPGAKRTRVMHAIGRHPNVQFKRIMDGTPVGEGPLDLYSQFGFLDPAILGYTSFYAFKHRYARWERGYNGATGQEFEKLIEYQNLDELQARMTPYSYRVTRAQVDPTAPPKVYQKRYFKLAPPQRKAYDELTSQYRTEVAGRELTAVMVLTRYLRLQQVASNLVPSTATATLCHACGGTGCGACDGGVIARVEPEATVVPTASDPRLQALAEELRLTSDPVIVWARFRADVSAAYALCEKLGRRPVRYDGACDRDQKEAAKADFGRGLSGAFVGSPASAGRGLALGAARTIIYYSNYFSLLVRLQSEDRAEAIGKGVSTGVVDLVAKDTVDDGVIVPALRAKRGVADYVMNEKRGQWL